MIKVRSKLGNGSFAQPLKLTAGGVNYGKLTAEQQKAMDTYVKTLGVPPGPPTQQGIYATPEYTGDPYPSEVIKPVEENQEPPEGWPRNPIFNTPGDVPGPPVQFGPPVEPTTVKSGEGFTGIGLPENDIFYFHPDHLGSTSYITARNGSISQHVEYAPFGEVLFEEHSSSFSSPYLFNGKELDRETNLSYYGARYLDTKTSLWLSVDPKMEKYPNESSYMYCGNNPIAFIDPDGMDRIYSSSGRLLKDTGKGNLIKVRIGGANYKLSQLDYKSIGTQRVVRRIIGTEAKVLGYDGKYGVKKLKHAGAHTENGKDVFVNTQSLKKGDYDDYDTLRNVLAHEADPNFGHKGENIPSREYTYLDHANVYLGQSQTKNFKDTSIDNQYTTAIGYAERIFASTQKESGLNVRELIKNYNTNNGSVKIENINTNNGTATINVNGQSNTIELKIPKTPHE